MTEPRSLLKSLAPTRVKENSLHKLNSLCFITEDNRTFSESAEKMNFSNFLPALLELKTLVMENTTFRGQVVNIMCEALKLL